MGLRGVLPSICPALVHGCSAVWQWQAIVSADYEATAMTEAGEKGGRAKAKAEAEAATAATSR